jgi:signal transduction histidine kinase
MEELSLCFLPFPHVFRGERRDGLTRSWPDRCSTCDRQCETSVRSGVQLCSYGLNYLRVDDDLLIAGVLAHDFPTSSSAFRRMRRKLEKDLTNVRELEAVLKAREVDEESLSSDLERRKQVIIDEYRRSEGYSNDVIAGLRPDVNKALSQVHDYRQLITQIVQNVNVILEADYPGVPVEQSLKYTSHELRAIYESARLMESKLEAALFLMYPERINDPSRQRLFRLHGLITKYIRIYQRAFDEKGLVVRISGLSYGDIYANPDAVGVIPHTILDNAVKYAPAHTPVIIDFAEGNDTIRFDVSSYGPRITANERARIFDLFFRGEAAACRAVGTGFGLGLARHVAGLIDASLSVEQKSDEGSMGTFLTTFSAVFRKSHRNEGR